MGYIIDSAARMKEAVMPPSRIYIDSRELRSYQKKTGNYGPIPHDDVKKYFGNR